MREIISLKPNKYQACMIITNVYCYNYHNQYDYIISSICSNVMNLRSSFKFPKLKMLDDHVHNILMNLSLNEFPLSPSTHQNLLKLL